MSAPRGGGVVLIGALVWLAAACAVVASGMLGAARPPRPQGALLALVAALLVLYWTPTPFARWARAVDVRALVAIHITRFVGLYFLVLYGRGELPWAFAVPGGLGDIAVAALAILACLLTRPSEGRGRGALLAWNAFGLLDILMVVTTAVRLALADPASMRALFEWPLGLVPAFLVPIIIATHVIIFDRLRRRG